MEIKRGISGKQTLERVIIILFCSIISVIVAGVLLFSYRPNQNALGALASVCLDVFSMAILFILVVSLVFGKENINRTTRLFLALMIETMVALFFDFLTWSSDGTLAYDSPTYVYTICSLVCGSILAAIFVLYLTSYMHDMYAMKTRFITAKVLVACNLCSFILTVILAVTKTAFIFEDGHYETGVLYDVVTVVPVLSLIYMTAYAVKHVRIIGVHDVIAVVGYIVTMITGALIEAAYGVGTSYVAVSVADVLIFLMLQNKLVERLIDRSNTDELTGFYNRHAYEDDIAALTENGAKENLVYVSIDVNGLKVTNDSKGHEAGDEMIKGASSCIKQCFGPYGRLYRTGGDEFVAIIYADKAKMDKISKDVEEVTEKWQGKLNDQLTMSWGFAALQETTDLSIKEMSNLADKRMYECKARYYQEKGIDRRGQRDAHVALCALYTKILKINLSDDTYQIINMNVEEQTAESGFSDTISSWLYYFGTSGQVHPDDLEEYQSKTKLDYISEHFKKGNSTLHVFYRRKYDVGYKRVMMEMIPANDYTDEVQTLYLYVKDIE